MDKYNILLFLLISLHNYVVINTADQYIVENYLIDRLKINLIFQH